MLGIGPSMACQSTSCLEGSRLFSRQTSRRCYWRCCEPDLGLRHGADSVDVAQQCLVKLWRLLRLANVHTDCILVDGMET